MTVCIPPVSYRKVPRAGRSVRSDRVPKAASQQRTKSNGRRFERAVFGFSRYQLGQRYVKWVNAGRPRVRGSTRAQLAWLARNQPSHYNPFAPTPGFAASRLQRRLAKSLGVACDTVAVFVAMGTYLDYASGWDIVVVQYKSGEPYAMATIDLTVREEKPYRADFLLTRSLCDEEVAFRDFAVSVAAFLRRDGRIS